MVGRHELSTVGRMVSFMKTQCLNPFLNAEAQEITMIQANYWVGMNRGHYKKSASYLALHSSKLIPAYPPTSRRLLSALLNNHAYRMYPISLEVHAPT